MPKTKYTATFTPEAWINDYAVPVDPEGPTEWDCSAFVDADTLAYLEQCAQRRGDDWQLDDVLDLDDVFKDDPAAPQWVREWRGPFTIRVRATTSVTIVPPDGRSYTARTGLTG